MPRRYCGDVQIETWWDAASKKFHAAILYDKGSIDVRFKAAGSVDDDSIALHALELAMERCHEIADAAASGIVDGKYKVTRSPCTSS